MLETAADFKYTDIRDVEGIIAPDGDVVPPLPVRAGVSVPFSSVPSGAYGELKLVDVAWLKEACQERETLLTGRVPGSGQIVTPEVLASDVLSVSAVLKAWADRWTDRCVSSAWCKDGVLGAFSSWVAVGGATITWEYSDRWADEVGVVPAALSNWRLDAPSELSWTEEIKRQFLRYALRGYWAVADCLGLVPDDDPETGRVAWKPAGEEVAARLALVKCPTILGAYSDMESTVAGFVTAGSTALTVAYRDQDDQHSVTTYTGLEVDYTHTVGEAYCGQVTRMHDPSITPGGPPPVDRTERRVISVSSGGLCACPDDADVVFRDVWSAVVIDMEDMLGSVEVSSTLTSSTRLEVDCFDTSNNLVGVSVADALYSEGETTRDRTYSRTMDSSLEFDLTERLSRTGATIESAFLLVFAVSSDLEVTRNIDTYLHTLGSSGRVTRGLSADMYGGQGECKFSVFMKLVECQVSGGVVSVSSLGEASVPSPVGGGTIELTLPEATHEEPQGTRVSPAIDSEELVVSGKRRGIYALGPLIVKFAPKTLVTEA